MNNNNSNEINEKIAVVLAGGNGKRFWPISNSKISEQFVYLIDNTTLFQKSVELIAPIFDRNSIYLVINKKFKEIAIEQTNLINEENIFVEPLSKQTAPALGLALTLIDEKYDDNTIICVFPSDQLIKNTAEYHRAINTACDAATNLNALVTIGIEPDRPVTNFGYIQFANNKNDKKNAKISDELFNNGIRKSINFAEKPDYQTAQRFINSGDFVWNSGILIAKKDILKITFQRFLNYHYEKFQMVKKIFGQEDYLTELENLYMTFNKVSIDYGILENAENIYVMKSSFSWNDINSWEEIHRVEMKDALDNVLHGNVVAINTNNSLAISNDKLVAIMGLDDIIVVNADNAILVCKKSEANKIDKLVNYIKSSNIPVF
jgi:mannose-1-phosphate guanylyltransferase